MPPADPRSYRRRVTAMTTTQQPTRGDAAGLGLTLVSVAIFSTLGVLTQLAFATGATVGSLLAGRFVVAAALLWLVIGLIGKWRRPTLRQTAAGLALGVVFSAHAWLFALSLARIDAGLVDLLDFTYPE